MNGREDLDKRLEAAIINRLNGKPEIIKRYYYWLPKRKSASTKKNYVNSIIRYADYLKNHGYSIDNRKYLSSVKKTDINMYADYVMETKKVGKTSRNEIGNACLNLYALKNFFEFLLDDGVIENSPFDRYEMPKNHKNNPIVALNKREVTQVKKNIKEISRYPERDIAIFTLGIRTGLRVSAIRSIDIDDINFKENTIRVIEKGNVERYIYFGDDTKEVLERYICWRNSIVYPGETALFLSNRGKRMTYNVVKNALNNTTESTGKHITPHKMRATCATNIYKKTGDIYLTADILGHRNLSNTRRYAQIDEENKRKAANILDGL